MKSIPRRCLGSPKHARRIFRSQSAGTGGKKFDVTVASSTCVTEAKKNPGRLVGNFTPRDHKLLAHYHQLRAKSRHLRSAVTELVSTKTSTYCWKQHNSSHLVISSLEQSIMKRVRGSARTSKASRAVKGTDER
jgi:hypothetical protein